MLLSDMYMNNLAYFKCSICTALTFENTAQNSMLNGAFLLAQNVSMFSAPNRVGSRWNISTKLGM
jgi:hypothetical protein